MPLWSSANSMARVNVTGLGAWSESFADLAAFRDGLRHGNWDTDAPLQPQRIPARERRRAPQLVKMAIDVMDQACTMAKLPPDDIAVVFSSSMGDMQITDYMCRALAETPKLISPTKFHNSVHNAAPGYWSITTGAFAPASAVSAYEHTAPMAFLEAAIQVTEESTPVLVVTQEVASTVPLNDICPSRLAFSAAFLLTPFELNAKATATLEFEVLQEPAAWPALAPSIPAGFDSNFGARLLPLLTTLALADRDTELRFPINSSACLALAISHRRG